MFPNGITFYLTGGLIIGMAESFVYILTGTHATQSSIFTSTINYFSKLPFFQRQPACPSQDSGDVRRCLRDGQMVQLTG